MVVTENPPTSGEGPSARFLELACLTYADDGPDRWAAAVDLLRDDPDLPRHDVHVAAATGDAEAALGGLLADPRLADARRPARPDPAHAPHLRARAAGRPVRRRATAARGRRRPRRGCPARRRGAALHRPDRVLRRGRAGPGPQPRHPQGEALAGLLLDHGADPNDGQTLYDRMFGRDDGHLRVLLAHGLGRGDGGVWRRRLGERQDSPQRMVARQVDWASEHGLTDRLELLASYGFVDGTPDADPSAWRAAGPLPPVAAAGTPDGVRALAARSGSGQVLDALVHGRTLLHHAAWIDDVELVRALLDGGADPQVLDTEHGSTPLGWAEWAYADRAAALLAPVTRPEGGSRGHYGSRPWVPHCCSLWCRCWPRRSRVPSPRSGPRASG